MDQQSGKNTENEYEDYSYQQGSPNNKQQGDQNNQQFQGYQPTPDQNVNQNNYQNNNQQNEYGYNPYQQGNQNNQQFQGYQPTPDQNGYQNNNQQNAYGYNSYQQQNNQNYQQFQGYQPQPNQNGYQNNNPQNNPNDSGSIGWGILGFFIPLVGLILFCVWRKDKPRSAKKAGIGALIGVIVTVVLNIVAIAIGYSLASTETSDANGQTYSASSLNEDEYEASDTFNDEEATVTTMPTTTPDPAQTTDPTEVTSDSTGSDTGDETQDSGDVSLPYQYTTDITTLDAYLNGTDEQKSAMSDAASYLEYSSFSKQRLIDILTTDETHTTEDAQYAVDNMGVDWQGEALDSAIDYLDFSSFSYSELYDQLSSEYGEEFTEEEAQYAVDNCGADWNEEAYEAAELYLANTDIATRSEMESQLEYDGYTSDQITYACDKVGL